MNTLVHNLLQLTASVAAAGGVCAAVAYGTAGPVGAVGALLAALICYVSGVVVLLMADQLGAGPIVVLGGTVVRLALVAGLGWLAYRLHGGLDWTSYLLSLGVIYLAALAAETWALYGRSGGRVPMFGKQVETQQ